MGGKKVNIKNFNYNTSSQGEELETCLTKTPALGQSVN